MVRRIRRAPRRRRAYSASPLHRHRVRVQWLQAQRIRTRNYLRRFGSIGNSDCGEDGDEYDDR